MLFFYFGKVKISIVLEFEYIIVSKTTDYYSTGLQKKMTKTTLLDQMLV